MFIRIMHAERLKLRRSPVWLAFLILPMFPAFFGSVNLLNNLGLLQLDWTHLWTQHSLFSSYFFYPALTGAVHEVIRYLKNRINNPASNAGEEFQRIAEQMKSTLAALIRQQQYKEAVSVMEQLCRLLPEDLELLRLRQELLLKLNGF